MVSNISMIGGVGDEIIDGLSGNDTLKGQGGRDVLRGNDGDDSLRGGTGDDTLIGGDGDDILMGDAGADELYGGDGNDIIYFDSADRAVSGGKGAADVAYFTGGGAITINDLEARGIEYLYSGGGSDMIRVGQLNTGLGVDYFIDGGAGNDSIFGSNGDDRLYGRAGRDSINGGSGDDIIFGGDEADNTLGDILMGGNGRDKIQGGAGRDKLEGNAGNDNLHGGSGNDTLDGGAGLNELTLGTGADRVVINLTHAHACDTVLDYTVGEDMLEILGTGGGGSLDRLIRDLFAGDYVAAKASYDNVLDLTGSVPQVPSARINSASDLVNLYDLLNRAETDGNTVDDYSASVSGNHVTFRMASYTIVLKNVADDLFGV